ncbi:hypothetical protein PHYPSEUDO_002248 [Phytophthora pseudosyringae]|uniref:RxLR effector protein n=1 Tax=Phytophthora pseudosyringae TaxID=221518 RepID=A0A8T1V2Y9_9STRA|nr:hypothetical protein PHYPSEUDO_002248 [Phytophthora pseudosyringae]
MRVGIILLAITTSILVLPATDGAVKGTNKLRTEEGSKNLDKYSKNADASALDDDSDADGKSADSLSTDSLTDEERGFSWTFLKGLLSKKALKEKEPQPKLRPDGPASYLIYREVMGARARLAQLHAERVAKT